MTKVQKTGFRLLSTLMAVLLLFGLAPIGAKAAMPADNTNTFYFRPESFNANGTLDTTSNLGQKVTDSGQLGEAAFNSQLTQIRADAAVLRDKIEKYDYVISELLKYGLVKAGDKAYQLNVISPVITFGQIAGIFSGQFAFASGVADGTSYHYEDGSSYGLTLSYNTSSKKINVDPLTQSTTILSSLATQFGCSAADLDTFMDSASIIFQNLDAIIDNPESGITAKINNIASALSSIKNNDALAPLINALLDSSMTNAEVSALVDQVSGLMTSLVPTLQGAISQLTTYLTAALNHLNIIAGKVKSDSLTVADILGQADSLVAALKSATLYIGNLVQRFDSSLFDSSDVTAVNTFYANLLPQIKAEILHQLEPWRTDTTPANTNSWLYENSTIAGTGPDDKSLDIASFVSKLYNTASWNSLIDKISGKAADMLPAGDAQTAVSITAQLAKLFVANISFDDLKPGNIGDLVDKYIYQYATISTDALAAGVKNRTEQIFTILAGQGINLGYDELVGIVEGLGLNSSVAGMIVGALVTTDSGVSKHVTGFTDIGNKLLAVVYKKIVADVADTIDQDDFHDLLDSYGEVYDNAQQILAYAKTNGNVDIGINGYTWTQQNGDYIYVLGSDLLSTNYDELIYGDGYYKFLNSLGVTFEYRLSGTNAAYYKITDNKIEALSPYTYPNDVTVSAYAVVKYNNYQWDVLLAKKDIKIVRPVTITFDYNDGRGKYVDTTITNYTQLTAFPTSPTRTDYSFDGWFSAATGGYQVSIPTNFNNDSTLYAHWTYTGGGGYYGGGDYYSPTPTKTLPETLAADYLYKMGLFRGVSSTSTPDFDLGSKLTRIQALVITIRFLGLENQALAYTGANPFTDVPEWADRYAAYAWSIGIANGIDDTHTLFDPENAISYRDFTLLMLRTLGYSDTKNDFVYGNTIDFARGVKLFASFGEYNYGNSAFLRGDAVVHMVNTLETAMRGGDLKLIGYLVNSGVVTQAQANALASFIASWVK